MNAMVVREAAWFEPSANKALRASQMASIIARTRQPTHSVVVLRQRSVSTVRQPLLVNIHGSHETFDIPATTKRLMIWPARPMIP